MPDRRPSLDYSHPFQTFRQAVRAYKPTELLPAVAKQSIGLSEVTDLKSIAARPPWAYATIARESLLHGNEYRGGVVDQQALDRLAWSFNQIYEASEAGPALNMLTRIAYEQFPFQEPDWSLLGRSRALLVDGVKNVSNLEVMDGDAIVELLGAPLEQAMGATFALWTGAMLHDGWVEPGWLAQSNFRDVLEEVPRPAFDSVLERLSASMLEARAFPTPAVTSGLHRYGFNVLQAKPLIKWHDGRLLAPIPRFILWTMSPGSLYFAGLQRFGEAFTRDLGHLVENYVGRQLALTDAVVIPEITYDGPNGQAKSIDYFVVWDDLVVLVEVKSSRLRLDGRIGAVGLEEQMHAILGEAKDQIALSAELVQARHPQFAGIPADRRMMGLVVTAEPLYMANSGLYKPPPQTRGIPVATHVASLADLEWLVVLPPGMRQHLIDVVDDDDRSRWYLGSTFKVGNSTIRNPILDAAWSAYPFGEGDS